MPKVVDHDQRRAELSDAALELIAQAGIAAVTTRAVAARAGWSTGVLNHYFTSRHQLLLGALRRAAEIQGRMFRELRHDTSTDPLGRLTLFIESVLPLDARRVAMTRIFLVFYAEAAANPDAREEIVDYLQNWRRLLSRIIGQAQSDGLITQATEAEQLATELVALSDGLAMHALLDDNVMQTLSTKGFELELVGSHWRLEPARSPKS